MVGRVLIVDDEDTLRLTIKTRLASAGFETDAAVDGEEALEKLKQASFDVVLLDINMPRMDGITALGLISELHPSTDVIMLTGFADFTTAIECLKKGAKDYLVKPIDTTELITRMRSLLRARNSEAALGEAKRRSSLFLAHDVLGAGLRTLEYIKNGKPSKGSKESGGLADAATREIETMIDVAKQMIDPGQLGAGSAGVAKSTQVSKLLEQAVKTVTPYAEARGCEASLKTDAKAPKLNADAALLEGAFVDVLTAAISVCGKGSEIAIQETSTAGEIRITVTASKTSDHTLKAVEQAGKSPDTLGPSAKGLDSAAALLLACSSVMRGHGGTVSMNASKGTLTIHCGLPLHEKH